MSRKTRTTAGVIRTAQVKRANQLHGYLVSQCCVGRGSVGVPTAKVLVGRLLGKFFVGF